MTAQRVSDLYDDLHRFEGRFRRGLSYPMHKRVRAGGERVPMNVYDWIVQRIEIPRDGVILDAGCGVGFGTLRLAQLTPSLVVGVSLSEREIDQARVAAGLANLQHRVKFRTGSFDDVAGATYRLIVAVESLKHSSNLAATLTTLRNALTRDGQLVIVDDMLTGAPIDRSARIMAADWGLSQVYSVDDYLSALEPYACVTEELSRFAAPPGSVCLAMQLGLLGLALPLVGPGTRRALRAFRGGLHLQRLYAGGAMSYRAIVCTAT